MIHDSLRKTSDSIIQKWLRRLKSKRNSSRGEELEWERGVEDKKMEDMQQVLSRPIEITDTGKSYIFPKKLFKQSSDRKKGWRKKS